MSTKLLYEVDPHNRLIIKKTGGASNVKRFRKVIKGRFKTDPKNRLYYEIFKSSRSEVPQKIKFSGRYSLDEKGGLIFTLDKWNNQYAGNRLRLKTGVIDANDNELIFMLASRIAGNKRTTYMMRLRGVWRADRNNRIGFDVERGLKKVDELTFFNLWRINKDNEIEYSYKPGYSALRLKGRWDVGSRNTLSYVLNKSIDSGFDFRTTFSHMAFKKNKMYLRFNMEITIAKKKRIRRKILFSGRLKLNKKKEIFLEFSPGKHKNLVLKLKKDIFGEKGYAFIESFLKGKEAYIGGGMALRW